MARKPARLERDGALTPRDRMWAAIRSLQLTPTCSWSPVEVQFLANLPSRGEQPSVEPMHVDSVQSYLKGLSLAQPPYVELVLRDSPFGRKRSELWLWRLLRDTGVEAPRVTKEGKPVTDGLANEQMWAAMKALAEFDNAELAAAATTPAFAVEPRNGEDLHHAPRARWLSRPGRRRQTRAHRGARALPLQHGQEHRAARAAHLP